MRKSNNSINALIGIILFLIIFIGIVLPLLKVGVSSIFASNEKAVNKFYEAIVKEKIDPGKEGIIYRLEKNTALVLFPRNTNEVNVYFYYAISSNKEKSSEDIENFIKKKVLSTITSPFITAYEGIKLISKEREIKRLVIKKPKNCGENSCICTCKMKISEEEIKEKNEIYRDCKNPICKVIPKKYESKFFNTVGTEQYYKTILNWGLSGFEYFLIIGVLPENSYFNENYVFPYQKKVEQTIITYFYPLPNLENTFIICDFDTYDKCVDNEYVIERTVREKINQIKDSEEIDLLELEKELQEINQNYEIGIYINSTNVGVAISKKEEKEVSGNINMGISSHMKILKVIDISSIKNNLRLNKPLIIIENKAYEVNKDIYKSINKYGIEEQPKKEVNKLILKDKELIIE